MKLSQIYSSLIHFLLIYNNDMHASELEIMPFLRRVLPKHVREPIDGKISY